MVQVNSDRLWRRLMEMAKIGATEKGGVCRLALSDIDRAGRDLFCDWARNAGCEIDIDAMGNIFATRPGLAADRKPIGSGSHLDSQPTGGKFDGVVGVLAALEVIETLNDHNIETQAPVTATVWTNEEGARFAPAMIGSGVYAGAFTLDYAYGLKDDDGKEFFQELKRIDYNGQTACGAFEFGAHLELHIEQGPILEAEGLDIGVVAGVQGIRWYTISVEGSEVHAGPSPMSMRRDPAPIVAEIISKLYEIAEAAGEDARCTIGRLDARPGSTNTVPGTIEFSLDLRHPDESRLEDMHRAAQDLVKKADESACAVRMDELWYSPPVVFDETCVDAVEKAALEAGAPYRKMTSGAGHDSVYISRRAPTGMIFIPCKDGISHNEVEDTQPAQVALGADVLLAAIRRLAG